MPSVEWMSVGREFGTNVDVYTRDAPSMTVNQVNRISSWILTLHQYSAEKL